ncbi:UTP--glucose-1-phosphate uridylyltransferase GalU [soil metagenome]
MIRKAVIPAAGFGTRMLPATKSQPKEMMPVVDKPVIQYVVEEAVESGITDILMIISKGKRAIEDHFDRSYELEEQLEDKGKTELLESIKHISSMANIHFVWQKEMSGLGDAIRYAKLHVGNEPFAVLLGDTIMDSAGDPVLLQLIQQYEKTNSSVVAMERVPMEKVTRYGIMDGELLGNNLYKARSFVEKPLPAHAPSDLAIGGRYIFTPEIFDSLDRIGRGVNNEIQLTDAMRLMLQQHDMYGYVYEGTRYDVGNTLDYIKTNIALGLQREDIGPALRAWLLASIK